MSLSVNDSRVGHVFLSGSLARCKPLLVFQDLSAMSHSSSGKK